MIPKLRGQSKSNTLVCPIPLYYQLISVNYYSASKRYAIGTMQQTAIVVICKCKILYVYS